MLLLSIILLSQIPAALAVSFDAGTVFKGEAGQGPITFTGVVECASMTSDGLKVTFTDFTMSGNTYGDIGFSSSVGCSMQVSEASATKITFTAAVTADLATATIYTPGKPNPVKIIGATSWSRVDDAVIIILPKATTLVTVSYTPIAPEIPDTGDITDFLAQYTPDIPTFIRENLLIISAAIIVAYLAGASGASVRRRVKRRLKQ
jgi:hypothetical protein